MKESGVNLINPSSPSGKINRELPTDKIFAIVDIETTGMSAVFGRIIEIGILRVENGKVVEKFNTLINPEVPLSGWITDITGITKEDLINAPVFADVAEKISELLDGAIFVAHNVRFDYGFVKNEFKRLGKSFNAKCLCTVRLSKKLFPEENRHDLSTLIERFNFKCKNRHRAFDDAEVLWQFMRKMVKQKRGKEMEEAIKVLLSERIVPQHVDEKSIRNLPETCGVYLFYGEEGELLYVGKSRNLRYRVLSHFSNDHTTTKEMNICNQVHKVEVRETSGELGALMLESELVKTLSPLYNRQLRKVSKMVIAKRIYNKEYMSISLEHMDHVPTKDFEDVLGIFKSISQAKQFIREAVLKHSLCQKVLGLEKGSGSCFHAQLGRCGGACTGKEEAEAYNERLEEAFEDRRIKAWPFKGAIIIEEEKDNYEKQSFILNNWCLLANVISTEYDSETKYLDAVFDYDAYKIFARYINDSVNRKNIKPFAQKDIDQFLRREAEELVIR